MNSYSVLIRTLMGNSKLLTATLAVAVFTTFGGTHARADTFTPQPWGLESDAGRCVVCHSLEKGGEFRVAPNLWNIVDAQIARDRAWYNYSPALIEMEGTWTPEELDRFLADASRFAPGSSKSIRISDPEEREAIIEFLQQLQD